MEKIFEEESTEAVLLVDEENAFNLINRNVFLHNISIWSPAVSPFVRNCYSTPARLFVIHSSELKYNEGTTQGDHVVMAIYALDITLLKMMMVELVSIKCDDMEIVAFTHDFDAAGKLKSPLQWNT